VHRRHVERTLAGTGVELLCPRPIADRAVARIGPTNGG
jgi:hypothetical protein